MLGGTPSNKQKRPVVGVVPVVDNTRAQYGETPQFVSQLDSPFTHSHRGRLASYLV